MDIKERCGVHGRRIGNHSGQAGVPERADTPKRLCRRPLSPYAVASLVDDGSIFGRALEVQPSGLRLIETPMTPGAQR
jgi:hypothetical protein